LYCTCFSIVFVFSGLIVGTSAAINIAGAIRVAQKLGRGHTIVTIIADYGTRYATKIFNPQFLRSRNLPVPRWLDNVSQYPQHSILNILLLIFGVYSSNRMT
jgi:hypothetical protein